MLGAGWHLLLLLLLPWHPTAAFILAHALHTRALTAGPACLSGLGLLHQSPPPSKTPPLLRVLPPGAVRREPGA